MTWIIQFVFDDDDGGMLRYGWVGPEGVGWCAHPLDAERFASRANAERFLRNGYGTGSREIAELVEVGLPMVEPRPAVHNSRRRGPSVAGGPDA